MLLLLLLLQVDPAALFWPEGSQGRRDFSVSLLAAPDKGVLTARLVHPTGGAVLHPSEAVVQALVDSPVVSFTTNLVSCWLAFFGADTLCFACACIIFVCLCVLSSLSL